MDNAHQCVYNVFICFKICLFAFVLEIDMMYHAQTPIAIV
jgi:hypothetical protein